MSRISRHHMFMMMARVVSLRSTCPRLNVGCVIVHNKNIVALGYNGSLSGEPHCTDEGCRMVEGSCVRTVHAEMNALHRVPEGLDVRTHGLLLYVTHSPCMRCAQAILNSPVEQVMFETPYKDPAPLKLLKSKGIHVYQCVPSGHIVAQI